MGLIEKEAFLEKMKQTNRYFSIKYDVEEMPEIDPVHYAGGSYCRDCTYKSTGRNNFGVYFYCGNPESGLSNIQIEKDFCSYGRRKENRK